MSEGAPIGAGDAPDELMALAASLAWRDEDIDPELLSKGPPSLLTSPAAPRSYGRLAFGVNKFGSISTRKIWSLSGLDPHVVIRLKRAFPKISQTETRAFEFPDTDESCADLEWFTSRYPVEISEADRARLATGRSSFGAKRDALERIMLPDWRPPDAFGFRPGFVPKPNQSRAIAVARLAGRLLIADDVGLGKTEAALGIIAAPDMLPAAIVVETHLATQWEERIARRTFLTSHIVASTQPYDLPKRDVYIFSYSKLAGWSDIAATGVFRSVVFDEIQNIRRGEFITSKGAAARVFCERAAGRFGLSATPVFNYGDEMFHVMNFIEPGCLGSWEEFAREWCTSDGRHWIVSEPEALGTYLREKHLLVREERAGGRINTVVHRVAYDQEVVDDFEELARALAIKVTSGSFTERGQASRELDMLTRQMTGVAKARHVAAFVRLLLEAGTPVLLAGWHREVYDIWLKELAAFRPVLYTGTETPRQKDAAKRAFEAGDTDLFIISLRSGAGLDGLQKRCWTCVVGELDWSPKVHDQLFGRLDRPEQPRDEVDAVYLIADEGSDPGIVEVLGLKASQSRAIMDPLAGPVQVRSDESRIRALAQKYLEKRA